MYRQGEKLNIHLTDGNGYGTLEKTTDLSVLTGRRVLVLLDEQNLSLGARDHGYRLDYGLLAKQVRFMANRADLHIFTASNPFDNYTGRHFEKLGYRVYIKAIRRIPLKTGGMRCDSNIDNLFAFWAGVHSLRNNWEVIMFGSGDYGLAGELSKAIYQCRRRQIQIMTLSLPGSTSRDLNAANNHCISANVEIGLDVLKP